VVRTGADARRATESITGVFASASSDPEERSAAGTPGSAAADEGRQKWGLITRSVLEGLPGRANG